MEGEAMERSLGVIGVGGVVAVLLAGLLGAPGGARQEGAGAVAGGGAGRAVSPEAQRRAVLDRAWTQAMEARCMGPSLFAAPTVLPAVC
jgi:uncharacterized protein YcfJ